MPSEKAKHVRKASLFASILLLTAVQSPLAQGQSCPDFDKAVEATMASNKDLDAQLVRFKAMGKVPSSDTGVCSAAKQLKEQAGAAAKLADKSCDPDSDRIIGALGDIAQSAETDVNLFCSRDVGTAKPAQPDSDLVSGFIFPDSDRRHLTVNELRGLSSNQ
jgi:hypothetical protein